MTSPANERQLRVERCVNLKANGMWYDGASHAELACEWEVTVSTVDVYAREADRLLRFVASTDIMDIRTRMITSLEAIRKRTLADPKPNYTAAIASLDLQARLLGLMLQREPAETNGVPWRELPAPERKERLLTAIERLKEMHDDIPIEVEVPEIR